MSKFAGNNLLLYPKGSTVCQNRTEEKGHGLPLSHLWNAFTHDRRENTGAPAFQLPKHFFGVLDKSFLPLSCLLTKSTDAKMQRKKKKKVDIDFLPLLDRSPVVWHSHHNLSFMCEGEREICVCSITFLFCTWLSMKPVWTTYEREI